MAPGIWWYEVRNVLVLNERRGRIAPDESERFLRLISSLVRVVSPRSEETLQMARKHGLSVYDAAYLALALHEGLQLSTLDRDLESAARAEGVALLA